MDFGLIKKAIERYGSAIEVVRKRNGLNWSYSTVLNVNKVDTFAEYRRRFQPTLTKPQAPKNKTATKTDVRWVEGKAPNSVKCCNHNTKKLIDEDDLMESAQMLDTMIVTTGIAALLKGLDIVIDQNKEILKHLKAKKIIW